MKTLIVYYSQSGNTRKVAEALSEKLGGDLEELKEESDRRGFMGYLTAGLDGMLKRKSEIRAISKDPSEYDIVLVGGPIWGFNLAPALRTFLSDYKGRLEAVAFFCTMGGSGDKRSFTDMEKECGASPKATLSVTEKETADGSFRGQVTSFAEGLGG